MRNWETQSALTDYLKARKYKKINAKLEKIVIAGLLGIVFGITYQILKLS